MNTSASKQLWEKVRPLSISQFWIYVASCMFMLSIFSSMLGVLHFVTEGEIAIINPFFTIACVFPVVMFFGFGSAKKRFDKMIEKKLENPIIIDDESKKEACAISAKEIILTHLGYLSVVSWIVYAVATFQLVLINFAIETGRSYTVHFAITMAIIVGTFTSIMRRKVREAKEEVEMSLV
jgi:hypothetical protein